MKTLTLAGMFCAVGAATLCGASIHGTVAGPGGAPLGGMTVEALRWSGSVCRGKSKSGRLERAKAERACSEQKRKVDKRYALTGNGLWW
jgi:hypothetical protein